MQTIFCASASIACWMTDSALCWVVSLNPHGIIQHFFRLFDKVCVKDFNAKQSKARNLNQYSYCFVGVKGAKFSPKVEPAKEKYAVLFPGVVEIFSHELHVSHRGTHVRDIEHD